MASFWLSGCDVQTLQGVDHIGAMAALGVSIVVLVLYLRWVSVSADRRPPVVRYEHPAGEAGSSTAPFVKAALHEAADAALGGRPHTTSSEEHIDSSRATHFDESVETEVTESTIADDYVEDDTTAVTVEDDQTPEVVSERTLGALGNVLFRIRIETSSGYGSAHASDEPSRDPDELWVPFQQSVKVGAYEIPDGMLYVGQGLRALGRWRGVEPALIDPSLPIAKSKSATGDRESLYSPSYGHISPEDRAGYLEWLAGGRKAADADIGYVFLFFYGLERRLLADAVSSPKAASERVPICAEIERLLGIYGENRSFHFQAVLLLDVIRVQKDSRTSPLIPPVSWDHYLLPAVLRVALGEFALGAKPIPCEWAWSWLVCDPQISLRTPAHRCPDEYRALFFARYARSFGDGLLVKANKSKVSISYRPASRSFESEVAIDVGDVPDISILTGPVNKLRELAETCADELSPYSRWLGRNPDDRNTLAAVALLPRDLLADVGGTALASLQRWLNESAAADQVRLVNGADLTRLVSDSPTRLGKAEVVTLIQLMEKLGYGVEPDVRFRGPLLSAEDPAVLFRLSEDSPSAPSPGYTAAALLADLGAMIVCADEDPSIVEQQFLREHLHSAGLSPSETTRLQAHVEWALAAKPGMAGIKKRVESLDDRQRKGLARYLVSVAGADGDFDPTEVSVLIKMYKLLGLAASEAYSDIHALSSESSPPAREPVTVRPADTRKTGFAIPARRKTDTAAAGPVDLDMGRVRATLAETQEVSALLTDIFAEDEAGVLPATVSEEAIVSSASSIEGLDASHAHVVRRLTGQSSWSRAEFEVLAEQYQLMPDGALDRINEVALDRCGEALCEGDDPLIVNPDVAKELLA